MRKAKVIFEGDTSMEHSPSTHSGRFHSPHVAPPPAQKRVREAEIRPIDSPVQNCALEFAQAPGTTIVERVRAAARAARARYLDAHPRATTLSCTEARPPQRPRGGGREIRNARRRLVQAAVSVRPEGGVRLMLSPVPRVSVAHPRGPVRAALRVQQDGSVRLALRPCKRSGRPPSNASSPAPPKRTAELRHKLVQDPARRRKRHSASVAPRWSPTEDAALLSAVARLRPKREACWQRVAEQVARSLSESATPRSVSGVQQHFEILRGLRHRSGTCTMQRLLVNAAVDVLPGGEVRLALTLPNRGGRPPKAQLTTPAPQQSQPQPTSVQRQAMEAFVPATAHDHAELVAEAKHHMAKEQLSQGELARRIGRSAGHVSQWMSGRLGTAADARMALYLLDPAAFGASVAQRRLVKAAVSILPGGAISLALTPTKRDGRPPKVQLAARTPVARQGGEGGVVKAAISVEPGGAVSLALTPAKQVAHPIVSPRPGHAGVGGIARESKPTHKQSTGAAKRTRVDQSINQSIKRKRSDLERIIEAETRGTSKGYWVQWAHAAYEPSWEAYRVPGRGAIGEPLVTWEPARNLKHTEVLAAWTAGGGGAAALPKRPVVLECFECP